MKRVVKCENHGEKNEVTVSSIETPWLTPRDAARYLGVSDSYFSRIASKIRSGPGLKGKVKRFHVSDLDAFLREEGGV